MKLPAYNALLIVFAVGLVGASGCDNRGIFTPVACSADGSPGGRRDIPDGAAAAIYVDEAGNPLGLYAEDLHGTLLNQMCPTPPAGGGGGCSPKPPWCTVTINNTPYCVRCK
jgi:hypothetical protein